MDLMDALGCCFKGLASYENYLPEEVLLVWVLII